MVGESVPEVTIGKRTEWVLLLAGVLAGIAAAYYTGQTGNWGPLMAVSGGVLLVVLFVTVEP